jgi:cellulose synthase/poly-beta-1,6-N-acetylglucosamine synthase-like glycosyltransferase
MLWDVITFLLIALTLPGTVELAFLTFGAWLFRAQPVSTASRAFSRIAVLVPAHNESLSIALCLRSLQACDPPAAALAIVVIADNCTDDTAAVAAGAGARVLERDDPDRRGKGYALDFAFRCLLAEGVEAFVVVDADSSVDRNFVRAFEARFAAGAEALQCIYRAPEGVADAKTRLRSILWFAFNVVRPSAREFWRLSVGILGNGFGMTRETLARVPYDVSSITEDLDYHLRLLDAGIRVEFLADTTVRSALPSGESAAGTQRARWEGGRIAAIREWTPRLLSSLLRGHRWALEPLLELWLLPLSYHVLLLVPLMFLPNALGRGYALAALLLVCVHAISAVRLGGRWRDLLVFSQVPVYLFWKLRMLPEILAKAGKNATWVRTDRS